MATQGYMSKDDPRYRLRDRVAPGKKEFAQKLRHNPTKTETMLQRRLLGNALGPKFRFQHIIRGWIVDFWCPAYRLVVEIDGSSHKGREAEDARRDRALRDLEITTLRFSTDEVLQDLDGVVMKIEGWLATAKRWRPVSPKEAAAVLDRERSVGMQSPRLLALC